MSLPKLFLYSFLLSLFPGGRLKVEGKVPAVIVFGDSTVDAGNNNQIPTIVKSNFAPYGRDFEGGKATGRFCNGRIATDFISEAFGIKPAIPAYLDPMYNIKDFATGVTFASAGTGLDNRTSSILKVIPSWKELEYFKDYKNKLFKFVGEKTGTETIQEALYIISIGTNDFIENYLLLPGRSSQYTIEEYENFLTKIAEKFVMELYKLGARKISIVGFPPVGCLPLVRTVFGHVCSEELNNLARSYDEKVKSLVFKLRNEVKGLKIVFTDIYYPALEAIQKPYLYGFTNTANGCCGSGSIELSYLCHRSNPFTCKDASKYAFWDAVHPSEKLNSIVARNMMKTSLAEFR